MKKKYLYNGQIMQEADVMDAAKQSNLDFNTYLQKAGIKAIDDNYSLNGKDFAAEDILDAANQSKLGFDDYIQKAGFQKKSSAATNGLQNGAPKPTTTSVPATLPLQENSKPKDEFHAPVQQPESEGILGSIYQKYPGLQALGKVTIKADPNFTSDKTGVGSIEYFSPEQDVIKYNNGFTVAHPKKGTHGILYDPKTNDEQSIMLDMLHGMKKASPEYAKYREELKNALLKSNPNDGDLKESIKYSGQKEGIENWVDGVVRNLMFEGTPEDFKKARYWDKAKDTYLKDPVAAEAFDNLKGQITGQPPGMVDVKAEAAKFEAANPDDHSIYDSYNPIDLVEQSNELLKPKSQSAVTPVGLVPAELPASKEDKDKAGLIKDNLKKRGFDPDNFKILSDFPKEYYNIPGFTKDEIANGLKTNPYRTITKIADAKWQIPIQENILKKSNSAEELAAFKENRNLFASDQSDYKTKRSAAKYLIQQIMENGGDSRDKLLQNFAISAAEVYGSLPDNHPDIQAQYLKYPHLDPAQIKYLNYLQDAAPDKAYAIRDALISPTKLEGNPDAQTGQEERLKRMEEGGIAMRENYLNGKLNPIVQKFNEFEAIKKQRPLTEEETATQQELTKAGGGMQEELDNLKLQANHLLIKYPKAGVNDAELFAQELLGQRHTGLDWLALETGRATGNAVNSILDLVSEPFRSNQNSLVHGLETLGDSKSAGTSTYLTQTNQINQTFAPTIKKEFKPFYDDIINDKTLTDKEKRTQLTQMLMQHPDQWRRTPIEDGKTNIGITSLLYGTGGLAANLAPFILAETITGGGATATFARKFTSGFASMMGTSFHESYAAALDAGERNPYAHALRTTAINAAAMAGAGTPAEIRKMLGAASPEISGMVGKLTDKQILKVLRNEPASMSVFRKGIDIAKGAGQAVVGATAQGAKGAIHILPWITGGQMLNEVMDDHAVNWQDHGKQAAIEGLKFTILGGIGGTISKGLGFARDQYLSRTNEIGKATLYTAASDPKAWLEALQQKEDNSAITKQDADEIRKNISIAHDIYKNTPMVDADGRPLSDRGRRELLFVKMQEKDITETMAKDIPVELKDKFKERLKGVHDKITNIYKGILPEKDGGDIPIKLLSKDDIASIYVADRANPELFKEFGNDVLNVADAYHKAQVEGKDTALIKKVNDILDKQEADIETAYNKDALKDVASTAKALEDLQKNNPNGLAELKTEGAKGRDEKSLPQFVAEIYHKAKDLIEFNKTVKDDEKINVGKYEDYVKKVEDVIGGEAKPKTAFGVGLSHGDWLDKNKNEFSNEDYNRLNDALNSTDEAAKKNAITEIVAKKEELKNATAPEKIVSAVIEINGKTYEGKNHAEAILKAQEAGEDISNIDRAQAGKFKLSDGTIIDRAEAKSRFGADRSEQLIPQDEAADKANADYAKLKEPDVKQKATAAFGKKAPAPETVETATKQLSREEALAEIRQNIPEVDNLTNREIADIADKRAKELQAQKQPATEKTIDQLKEQKLDTDQKYKPVEVTDPLTGETIKDPRNKNELASAWRVKDIMVKRHGILDAIIKCLT